MITIYKAGDAKAHAEFGKKLWNEYKSGEYVIKITKNKPIRSLGANNYFHMVLSIYASYTGHYLDEIKDEFKLDVGYYDLVTDKQGKQFKRLKSTSEEDTTGMSRLTNQLLQWGRDKHPECIIPRLEDATYLQWIQVQNEYEKVFSGF